MSQEEEAAIVSCGTSAGPIQFQFFRAWSPLGYDRAVELFERGFYDDTHFYRTVPNFLVQFGITYSSDQELKRFARKPINDDPQWNPRIPFEIGTVSYAGSGENSRTSQLFIAYEARKSFGTQKWETPIGKVISGMENVQNFFGGYGDMPPWGKGPVQGKVHSGRSYIDENFPRIDHFETCTVERNTSNGGTRQRDSIKDSKTKNDDDNAEGELIMNQQKNDETQIESDVLDPSMKASRKLRFRDRIQKLQSDIVQSTDESYDNWIIAMFVILVILLLLVNVIKVACRNKKTAKTS